MNKYSDFRIHPVANIFPLMDDAAYETLKADIAANGQWEMIMMHDEQIIDGRNRLRVCCELGIEPNIGELPIELDPYKYAVGVNLHRRHLTTAQRAMVADKLATLRNGEKKAASGIPLPSQPEAAKALHVSNDSVKMARKVRTKATPEVIAAVERGELSLNAAVETTKPKTSAPAEPAKSGRGDAVTNGKPTEPSPTKSLTMSQVNYTLLKMSRDKKRHVQIMEIIGIALSRLKDEERCDVLSRQLLNLSPEDLGKVYDVVDQRQRESNK